MSEVSQLERLQTDLTHYLLSEEELANVVIVQVRPRTAEEATGIQGKLDRVLSGLESRNGKRGISVFVGMPVLRSVEANLSALHGDMIVIIRVVEKIVVNMGAGGTGMSAELVAERVAAAVQHHAFDRGQPIIAEGEVIRPDEQGVSNGNIEYEVTVRVPAYIRSKPKAALPTASFEAGVLTLSTTTAGGAIYYTLDESLPGPGNPDAVLYSAPVALPGSGPWEVRAATWAAGFAGSYETRVSIEATP